MLTVKLAFCSQCLGYMLSLIILHRLFIPNFMFWVFSVEIDSNWDTLRFSLAVAIESP